VGSERVSMGLWDPRHRIRRAGKLTDGRSSRGGSRCGVGQAEHQHVAIETRSLPSSLAATHHGFAFYVALPKRSIPSIGTYSMSLIPQFHLRRDQSNGKRARFAGLTGSFVSR